MEPKETREAKSAQELERRLTPPPPGFRLFHPQDRHLTLAFLGACGEERAMAVFDQARAWRARPFRVTLGSLVTMGPKGRYSALAFLLEEGRQALEISIEEQRPAWLELAGARPDSRPATPHVTLARPARRASEATRRAGLGWAASLDAHGLPFVFRELALYTWSESRQERLFRIARKRDLEPA